MALRRSDGWNNQPAGGSGCSVGLGSRTHERSRVRDMPVVGGGECAKTTDYRVQGLVTGPRYVCVDISGDESARATPKANHMNTVRYKTCVQEVNG